MVVGVQAQAAAGVSLTVVDYVVPALWVFVIADHWIYEPRWKKLPRLGRYAMSLTAGWLFGVVEPVLPVMARACSVTNASVIRVVDVTVAILAVSEWFVLAVAVWGAARIMSAPDGEMLT